MPSKGIDVYSYIGIPNCTVEFAVPGTTFKNDSGDNFRQQHLEVDSKKLPGRFEFDGEFSFKVIKDGKEIASKGNVINTLSGDLVSGTMMDISLSESIVKGDTVVTYGFYDAGAGDVGLANSHQCYVTVTRTHDNWQGDLAPKGSDKAKKPFGTFALPAPHDPGMNTIGVVDKLLAGGHAGEAIEAWTKHIKILGGLFKTVSSHISDIIYGLAITQKDPISRMLQMGCRYFEYRPAYMEDKIRPYSPAPGKDALWFQHACIPGMAFEDFIGEIVKFLGAHPTEIVATRICWDGVVASCQRPSNDDVKKLINKVIDASKTGIKLGDKNSLSKPIDELRDHATRLIVLTSDVSKYDSYDDKANATFDGKSMVERYKGMDAAHQKKAWYTVLQCQATATNIPNVLAYSVATSNASTSCLMETKARCDMRTLPWIRDNAAKNFEKNLLMVVMNDFIDGATVDTAIELSKKRFQ